MKERWKKLHQTIPALLAYAKSVEKDNPEFACDVEALAESKSWDDFNL
jgi:hypothetical protein